MATRRGRPRSTADGGQATVRTLSRGLNILEALAAMPNMTVAEVANEVDLPLSTVYRLLETLQARGFVDHDEQAGGYSIGLQAFHVGNAFVRRNTLVGAANSEMINLVQDVNETVNLALRDRHEAVYLHQVEGSRLVKMFTQVGARTPLHASGVGKVLLAWEDGQLVQELLTQAGLVSFTPNTMTRYGDVLLELRKTRDRGYGLDWEERELGVVCVAAPVRNHLGTVIAALSVSVPLVRLGGGDMETFAKKVMASADRVSHRLGWLGD